MCRLIGYAGLIGCLGVGLQGELAGDSGCRVSKATERFGMLR